MEDSAKEVRRELSINVVYYEKPFKYEYDDMNVKITLNYDTDIFTNFILQDRSKQVLSVFWMKLECHGDGYLVTWLVTNNK